jgi:hypothetical protein
MKDHLQRPACSCPAAATADRCFCWRRLCCCSCCRAGPQAGVGRHRRVPGLRGQHAPGPAEEGHQGPAAGGAGCAGGPAGAQPSARRWGAELGILCSRCNTACRRQALAMAAWVDLHGQPPHCLDWAQGLGKCLRCTQPELAQGWDECAISSQSHAAWWLSGAGYGALGGAPQTKCALCLRAAKFGAAGGSPWPCMRQSQP